MSYPIRLNCLSERCSKEITRNPPTRVVASMPTIGRMENLVVKKYIEVGIPIQIKLRIKPTNPKSGDRPSRSILESLCRSISKTDEKEIPVITNGTEITMSGLINSPRLLLIHKANHVRNIVTETGGTIS